MVISRRKFLIITGALAVAGSLGYPRLRQARRELLFSNHVKGTYNATPFDPKVITPIALFTGALFGRQLEKDNLSEMISRLDYATKADSGWRDEYAWLSDYITYFAAQMGAPSFLKTSAEQRDKIVMAVMHRKSARESRMLALVSEHERGRRRMISSTIPHLVWVYNHSGVPWRYRGYKSWPGVPGDTFEYTKPGPAYKC